MDYDQSIFNQFRAKAVTSIDELEIGRTYYSNSWPEQFTLLAIMTTRQMCEYRGGNPYDSPSLWMLVREPDGNETTISANDHNIGSSYNPWLVFENEADAEKCRSELTVTYSPCDSDWYDDFDCYDEPCAGEA